MQNVYKTKSFFSNVILLAGGTLLAQVIILAGSPVVTRLFSPEDMGVLSIYTSILSMIAAFGTLKFEFAIPIAEDESSAINILVLTVSILSFISLSFLAISLIFSEPITKVLNAENLEPYFWLLSVGIFITGLYTTLVHWGIRSRSYKRIASTRVNQGVAKVSTQIVSGVLKFGPLGLIAGEIIGQSFGIGTLAKSILKNRKVPLKNISWNRIKNTASRYRKFPLVSSWSALMHEAFLQTPVLMLSGLYGTSVAGSFGFAQRMVFLPISLVGVAVSQVFFSEGAVLVRENPTKLLEMTVRISRRLFFIGLFIAGFLVPFGESIFSFVFGIDWREAGIYSQILSVSLIARFPVEPISRVLSIIEKQGTQFLIDLMKFALVLTSFYVSKLLNLDSIRAVIIYSVSMFIVYLVAYGVIIKTLKTTRVRHDIGKQNT